MPSSGDNEYAATLVVARYTKNELEAELVRRASSSSSSSSSKNTIKIDGSLDTKTTTKLSLVPTKQLQWIIWRKMACADLKSELQKRSLNISGNNEELLARLGVPTGFGESPSAKRNREKREAIKDKNLTRKCVFEKLKQVLVAKNDNNKKQQLAPDDDPTHKEYTIDCCQNFWSGTRNEPPAGCIMFPDGSAMEVWRCLNCGKIPKKPNAPLIHEYDEGRGGDSSLRSVFAIARNLSSFGGF